MEDYSKIALSLTNPLRNPNEFKCTEKCAGAFKEFR